MRLFGRAKPVGRRRRNSELPERSTPPVYAYHGRRESGATNTARYEPRAERPTESWLHATVRLLGLLLLLVAIAAATVSALSLSSNPRIVIQGAGDNPFLADNTTYQSAATRLLKKSIWNHSKLTINTAKLASQLKQQFPELQQVSVTLPLVAHRPVVYLLPAQPAVLLATAQGQYVLDNRGTALGLTSPGQIVHTSLVTVNDQSGLNVKLGRQVLPESDVSFIQTVAGQLAVRHLSVASMDLPPRTRELDIHLVGQPYFIKCNLANNDARQQIGTFLATIAQLQHQGITPSQYVDVRVDGRAYYQ